MYNQVLQLFMNIFRKCVGLFVNQICMNMCFIFVCVKKKSNWMFISSGHAPDKVIVLYFRCNFNCIS